MISNKGGVRMGKGLEKSKVDTVKFWEKKCSDQSVIAGNEIIEQLNTENYEGEALVFDLRKLISDKEAFTENEVISMLKRYYSYEYYPYFDENRILLDRDQFHLIIKNMNIRWYCAEEKNINRMRYCMAVKNCVLKTYPTDKKA